MQQVDFSRIQRILIIKLRHHGDVLLISPLPTLIRQRYPHIRIDALVYADTRPLIEHHPDFDTIHVIDRSWKHLGITGQIRAEWQLLSQLKLARYDLILHLTEHWRGALLCRLLKPPLAVVASYPRRRAFVWWEKSFSQHVPVPGRLRHTVEKHLDTLRVLGLHPEVHERNLVLGISARARSKVDDLLKQYPDPGTSFILVHPTSRWLFKSWSPDRMAQLLDELSMAGHRLILTAAPAPEEMQMLDQIMAQMRHNQVLSLAGQLNLDELAALIERSRLFIGMDSAPMHMAAALNIPTVCLFGPSGDMEWGPWMPPERRRIITADPERYPCRPCGLAGCGDSGVADCLQTLPVAQVRKAVEELLCLASH